MRFLLSVCVIVIMLTIFSVAAYGQATPTVRVFFNEFLTQQAKDCPGAGLSDTLWVAALDADVGVVGAEYQILYPSTMTYLADVNTPPATIGASNTGISMGFPLPLNGFEPVLLHRVVILWNCSDCTGIAGSGDPIVVVPNPNTAEPVSLVRWPDFQLVTAVGMTSLVCATVPASDQTWGGIKALYDTP